MALAKRALRPITEKVELILAGDGRTAIERLADESLPLPHVAILDYNLPYANGVEVLEYIRSNPRTQLMPVVFLSSSYSPRDVQAAYDAHANGYMTKPNNPNQLPKMLRLFYDFCLDMVELPDSDPD